MTKIISKPLGAEGMKAYLAKNPIKYKDKFGDLDPDNLPKEYMKMGWFPTLRQDGTPDTDSQGNPIFHEEEYFDALAYRQKLLATRPRTPLLHESERTVYVREAPKVDSTNVDGGNTLENNNK